MDEESPIHQFFSEKEELMQLIQCELHDKGSKIDEIKRILDKYQEQPYLIEKHLESIMVPLMNQFKQAIFSKRTECDSSYEIIYWISKVCSYKSICTIVF